jgi:hypothetical protein
MKKFIRNLGTDRKQTTEPPLLVDLRRFVIEQEPSAAVTVS